MTAIIYYPTALEYWLDGKGIPPLQYSKPKGSELQLHSKSNFYLPDIKDRVDSLNFTEPVHIAVPPGIRRNYSDLLIPHLMPRHCPNESFIQISKDLWICSPEMCFLLAAADLTIPELVDLANNLCSRYVKDELSQYGQTSREPVTSVQKIENYLAKIIRIDGIKQSKIAIKYASDDSNSPVESKLSAFSALAIRHGGYRLAQFGMNRTINLSREAKKILNRDHITVDMLWSEQKIVVEYDSDLAHFNKQQFHYDKKRSTALTLSGYTVINVTADDLKSFSSIERLFFALRKKLNMPTFSERFEKHFETRWQAVRRVFFNL